MYRFEEKINYEKFWRFDKQLVRTKRWARLPSATKRIYPVIAVHANKKGVAWPSQETIAILTGCTKKTVREGNIGIFRLPNHKVKNWDTKRGHRAKKYKFPVTPDERGRAFDFRRSVIDGGNWFMLKPTAQALYPVVKTFAYFDLDEYRDSLPEEGGDDIDGPGEFWGFGGYEHRKWDFLSADMDVLAEYAGIGNRSVENALANLEQCHLIQYFGRGVGRVFTEPPKYYLRDFLNEKVAERYAAETVG